MTELLKCPYCGSKKEILHLTFMKPNSWKWFCGNRKSCKNESNILFETEQEAIAHANRRTK